MQRNPGVRRLAANPLLLTILALMKRQGVTLPERRVELYDQYVRDAAVQLEPGARPGPAAPARDLDAVQTMRVLAPLALWMHEVNPGVGLVKREALRRKLEAIYTERGEPQPEAAATQFLEDVREHAGLLLERGPGEYGFIHLTFEEYLAGAGDRLAGPAARSSRSSSPSARPRGRRGLARGGAAGHRLSGDRPAARRKRRAQWSRRWCDEQPASRARPWCWPARPCWTPARRRAADQQRARSTP